MKTILAVMLTSMAGMLLLLAFVHVQSGGLIPSVASSSSQIYIHGTPVCVTQQGQDIVAQVGECAMAQLPPDADVPEKVPFHGHPGTGLPPGHPPIDQEMFPEENRRVLI